MCACARVCVSDSRPSHLVRASLWSPLLFSRRPILSHAHFALLVQRYEKHARVHMSKCVCVCLCVHVCNTRVSSLLHAAGRGDAFVQCQQLLLLLLALPLQQVGQGLPRPPVPWGMLQSFPIALDCLAAVTHIALLKLSDVVERLPVERVLGGCLQGRGWGGRQAGP